MRSHEPHFGEPSLAGIRYECEYLVFKKGASREKVDCDGFFIG
jgi:hypothetical protein